LGKLDWLAELTRTGGVSSARATGHGGSLQQKRRLQMNWNQVEGNWEQFKGKVQTQWGKLTDNDLDIIKGNRKQLSGKIQERYGKAQEVAEREVDDWVNRLH
jgi:uncharacterized protein YjbJ (UPF0337 family)